jgi:beta-mannosidase
VQEHGVRGLPEDDIMTRGKVNLSTFVLAAGLLLLAGNTQAAEALGPGESATGALELSQGWRVLQDVHDAGERLGIYRRAWNANQVGPSLSDWEPLERLAHLQLLFAPQPYFGRELRYFNQAPWWYRLEFATPPGATKATLRFEGVDYYAKVWLNEKLLGEHEGYAEPFEFEVGPLLSRDKPNLLIVKVSSPWDNEVVTGKDQDRVWGTVRHLIKGTYEHADTFVQRDVNPIGIWRPVRLILHDGLRAAADPTVTTRLSENAAQATVSISWPLALDEGERETEVAARIRVEPGGAEVARTSKRMTLRAGTSEFDASLAVASPRLWSTWDRGGPALYRLELEVRESGRTTLARRTTFGIRTVELRRTQNETRFLLNGKPIYLRGATYWPDVYLSAVDRARYERDLAAAVRVGINALRIHVHTENPEFYDLCDRMGIVVLQDSDLNWVFPTDEAFTQRALAVVGGMIKQLRNHPSIICWVTMNEAHESRAKTGPGSQLVAEAMRLDPTRPTIRNCGDEKDLESGDTHDYRGSLGGGQYTDIYGSTAKLATEFGVDAPPGPEGLRLVPRLAERLADVMPRLAELHDYQYRLLKYYIEHYRMQKYAPNAGYFQFMWIDFCPQSFYGVYDYWGRPKTEGIGGGVRALEESNQPLGIFMEYKDTPVALHAVNDSLADLGECTAEWTVTTNNGQDVAHGKGRVHLGPDSHARLGDLSFAVEKDVAYRVVLSLRAPDGRELARNVYLDPFHHPQRPEGHPGRMDPEIGMRLWWAGETK